MPSLAADRHLRTRTCRATDRSVRRLPATPPFAYSYTQLNNAAHGPPEQAQPGGGGGWPVGLRRKPVGRCTAPHVLFLLRASKMNLPRRTALLAAATYGVLASCLPFAYAQAAAPAKVAYLFTSFRGNGDGLHLACSDDARRWQELPGVLLKPEVGGKLMRDSHLLRGPDDVYRLVWTTGWHDTGIGYASSKDLVHWSEQRYLPVMEKTPGTKNCWAPETIYDAKRDQYVITWSSDVEGRYPETASEHQMNNRTYYVTTRDFETFSEPQVLIEPGFDHIDTTIIPHPTEAGRFVAILKEGDQQGRNIPGAIRAAIADDVLGPYTLLETPVVTRFAEGPAAITIAGETRVYVDLYHDHRYAMYVTRDFKTWRDASADATFVSGQRHGTVLAVPAELVQQLIAREQPAQTQAPKPILDGFTADPAIRVFGDTYYVYPTCDKPHWNTTEFAVWSSKNLVDWKKEGVILDVTKDLAWADLQAWAPDCIERNGTYYFYFCARGKIGVATAPTPTGPFKDALGRPLLIKGGAVRTNTIDPYPFIDDDGQAYLYFGNGDFAQVCKLKPDMITLDGNPIDIRLKEFREGIVVFKRAGKYYFMWSIDDARSPDYRIGWGVADSPLGPVKSPGPNDTDAFIVLRQHGAAIGTGHHSVVNVPGTDRWYTVYHRHTIPNGSGYQRETCLVQMEFRPDGSIKPMDPLTTPFQPGDVGEPIDLSRVPAPPAAATHTTDAPRATLTIHADGPGKPISPHLFGVFFEDINYAADGGLYAELVQNRSFEYQATEQTTWNPLRFWELAQRGGGRGSLAVDAARPLHRNNPHYVVLDVSEVGDGVGLVNPGFDGIPVRAGEQYDCSLFARQLYMEQRWGRGSAIEGKPMPLVVRLEDGDGHVLGEAALQVVGRDWQRLTATITATDSHTTARLVVLANAKGGTAIDEVSLFPRKTFRGRKNGLRADLAEAIAALQPRFVRFPGGCLVHGNGLGNMYRWQDTIGPVEQRRGQANIWGYHQSVGLGFFEYFQFCEDIGAAPVPILPAGVCCQNAGHTSGMGQEGLPRDEMPAYVQEVLDLIEYANGPADSAWGAKRAAAGHPAPFNLKYVGIGNEDKITPVFEERFRMIYDALKTQHPEITVIGTAGPGAAGDDYQKGWKLANALQLPIVDEHYYESPEWFWSHLQRYDTYDRTRSSVYVGEYAAHERNRAATLRTALAEAAYLTSLERNGDVVVMASYAPLLGKVGKTQWNPDLIYFTNTQVVPTINYYVQQVFSRNAGDVYFDSELDNPQAAPGFAASAVRDNTTGDLIVKLVHDGDRPRPLRVAIAGDEDCAPRGVQTVLACDDPLVVNRLGGDAMLTPLTGEIQVGQSFDYDAPPHSLTVFRLKRR